MSGTKRDAATGICEKCVKEYATAIHRRGAKIMAGPDGVKHVAYSPGDGHYYGHCGARLEVKKQ